MIEVALCPFDFDYDVQALVRCFYPEEKLLVRKGQKEEKGTDAMLITLHMEEYRVTVSIYHKGSLLGSIIEEFVPTALAKGEIQGAPEGEDGVQEGEEHTLPSWYKNSDKSENSDRTRFKNVVKRALFRACRDFGCVEGIRRTIPLWGTMTGVRPAKIAMRCIEQGKEPWEVQEVLQREYLCTEEKAKLSIEVARKEAALLAGIEYQDAYSLYVGIPFCPTTCLYCSFTSYPIASYQGMVEAYITTLQKEMAAAARQMKGKKLITVYVGGGTPTSLSAKQLEKVLSNLREQFDLTYLQELSVEAGRPDSITRDKLRVMKKYGVSRISVNPQTMKEETLQAIGRKHTAKQIKEAFHMAREEGFDSINMDLIMGLPDETLQDFAHTMEEITLLEPDSITLHSLVIKRAAALRSSTERGEFHGSVDVPAMQAFGDAFMREKGYHPYYMYRQKNKAGTAKDAVQENVAYAKEGKECLYNILIMEEKQTIVALGAGASTKIYHPHSKRVERIENVKNIQDYISRIDEMIGRKWENE